MRPLPGEPPSGVWVPICRWCWVGQHDRCLGGTETCDCLCPCYWQPPDQSETL